MFFKGAEFIATVGYVGRLPKAPGTWGTLVGFFVTLLWLQQVGSIRFFGISCLLIGFIGWIATEIVLRATHFKDRDPQEIVIDEVWGYGLAVLCVGSVYPLSFWMLISIFIVFRFFDILKPFPINIIDRKLSLSPHTAAAGVMLDDGLAGLASSLTIIAAYKFLK